MDESDARALLRKNAALRAENLALRELCLANAKARQQAAQWKAQLDEIHGSRAWAAVRKARRIAAFARLIKGAASLTRGTGRPLAKAWTSSRPDQASGGMPASLWACRSRPRVSVIVPNYNHAPYLEERLRSIFRQTYPPHEILFLDDASSDESVEAARRLATESPVPFRLVLNETNSGSTFRQWLKGIDLTAGDLVWIAESDDTCRPELLERLVPEFFDPEVMLAYCQSAIIGPDGEQHAADYLSSTEDLSPTRWRYPYCVAGREEVELALSQRNTIPNASAVVFRKPADLDDREDLEQLKLGGDWLFYAMRIRCGKIAYVPESLNGHRHHDRSVRNAFERAVGLFEEQLVVKARIFESFRLSLGAMSCSMARSFVEYIDRTRDLGPHPAMTEHPRLIPHIDRLRSVFRTRRRARQDVRILIVLSGLTRDAEQGNMIRLANELAGRCQVFLCNALPGVLDPFAVVGIDERIIPLEGTLGILPWSWDGDPRTEPEAREAVSSRRAEVVRELIRFHGIDVIQSCGPWAAQLLNVARPDSHIPRFVDPRELEDFLAVSPAPMAAIGSLQGVRRDVPTRLGGAA
jgi:glycosyltransferase involved in cell wall biosynthesis